MWLHLPRGLYGVIRTAANSPQAHSVMQSLIGKMPMGQLAFIVLEFAGVCVEIAKRRCGYHVLFQSIEHLMLVLVDMVID